MKIILKVIAVMSIYAILFFKLLFAIEAGEITGTVGILAAYGLGMLGIVLLSLATRGDY